MWKNFDGKPYTRDQLAARIASADFSNWRRKDGSVGRPLYIVLHNTSDPTIKLWLSWPPAKRSQYILNAQADYENNKHWLAGPHFFVPPDDAICAFGFSDLTTCGTHASCFNSDSIGIEMVGEFDNEDFDQGPGALVRDNAVYLMALLHNKLGLQPEPYVYGRQGLHFHIECKQDDHDCPGTAVHKPDVVALIKAKMSELAAVPAVVTAGGVIPAAAVAGAQRFTNITATVFGGTSDDEERSAYDQHLIDDHELGVALPSLFKDPRPQVRVIKGSKSAVCSIVDVGPWNKTDAYWTGSGRPRSETQRAQKQKADDGKVPTNDAGIDLTPGAARAVGVDGKDVVDWEFVSVPASVTGAGNGAPAVKGTGPISDAGPKPPISGPQLPDLLNWLGQMETTIGTIKAALVPASQPAQQTSTFGGIGMSAQTPTNPAQTSTNLDPVLQQALAILQAIGTQTAKPQTPVAPAAGPQDVLQKMIGILNAAMGIAPTQPGGTPASQLGPVNGALGQTIGNLLNGNKSAIGIIGALITSVLQVVGPNASTILPFLSPGTLGGVALPVFLAITAWGVLGKMEKWNQAAAAPAQSQPAAQK